MTIYKFTEEDLQKLVKKAKIFNQDELIFEFLEEKKFKKPRKNVRDYEQDILDIIQKETEIDSLDLRQKFVGSNSQFSPAINKLLKEGKIIKRRDWRKVYFSLVKI